MRVIQYDGPAMWQELFDRYAEKTITDEQAERILAPVIVMIQAGRFDKPEQEQ